MKLNNYFERERVRGELGLNFNATFGEPFETQKTIYQWTFIIE